MDHMVDSSILGSNHYLGAHAAPEGFRSVTWRGEEDFLVRGAGEEEVEARCTSSSSRSKKYRPFRRVLVATTRPEVRSKTVAPTSVKRQSKPREAS